MYEPIHQISMWGDFKGNGFPNTPASVIIEVDTKQDSQVGICKSSSLSATKPLRVCMAWLVWFLNHFLDWTNMAGFEILEIGLD